jgi:hypothetical protein
MLWDVARGASSLIVSSLVVASNGMSSGVALHGINGAWSSRASKLALSLDIPMMYCLYASWYPYWYRRCSRSLESPELCHLWEEMSVLLGEYGRELVIVGVGTCVLT